MTSEGRHDHVAGRRFADRRGGLAAPAHRAARDVAPAQTPPAPAVRRKVKLSYWTWADNPGPPEAARRRGRPRSTKAQGFVTVELDATSRDDGGAQEGRRRLRRGRGARHCRHRADPRRRTGSTTASCIRSTSSSESGTRSARTTSRAWSRRCASKPGQPVLYMPIAILPYVLYYRADWFDEAKLQPPSTYEEFIAAAESPRAAAGAHRLRAARRRLLRPCSRSSRSGRSAGVKFIDEKRQGRFRFAGRAIAITEQLGRHVHEGQVGAADRRERPLPAAVRPDGAGQGRHVDLRHACHPAAQRGARRAHPGRADADASADRSVHAGEPGGPLHDHLVQGEGGGLGVHDAHVVGRAGARFTPAARPAAGAPSSRPSAGCSSTTASSSSRSLQAANWWRPPFSHKHWANYQDKIAPYWQQALRQEISVKDFHAQAAKFLRGEA